MKPVPFPAPSREAKIDARCSKELKQKLLQFAAIREIDLSDIVREALKEKIARMEHQHAIAVA